MPRGAGQGVGASRHEIYVVGKNAEKRPLPRRRVQRERGEQQLGGRGHWVAPKPQRAEDGIKPALPGEHGERLEVGVLVDCWRARRQGTRAEHEFQVARGRGEQRCELGRRRRALLGRRLAAKEQRDRVVERAQLAHDAEQPEVGANRLEVVLVNDEDAQLLAALAAARQRSSRCAGGVGGWWRDGGGGHCRAFAGRRLGKAQ